MSRQIEAVFKNATKPVFIPFVTAGYPSKDDTVPIMLAMQKGGAGIIELGVPFSDPIADGGSIQAASFHALKLGITMTDIIEMVKSARKQGLTVPVILMGYYNPVLAYGELELIQKCAEPDIQINGFIIVDTDIPDFKRFGKLASSNGLSLIPLVAPTTTDERLKEIGEVASGFVYCVSVTGVTGERKEVSDELPKYCERVKSAIDLPRAVGFGFSTHEHFKKVATLAEGCVMGSKVISVISQSHEEGDSIEIRCEKVRSFCATVIEG